MVQSVQRALGLLEELDGGGPAGWSLGELCLATGLKAPTAHNLLSTLVGLGYALRDGGTRRYRLGPRAGSLGTGRARLAGLRHLAWGPMRHLHEALNETVILAVEEDGRRRSLASFEGDHELRVRGEVGVDDHFYDTATGRVLLSLRSLPELGGFVAERGLPGEEWPEAATVAGLHSCLDAIRREGHADVVKSTGQIRALAIPVCVSRLAPRASLGLFYPTVREAPGRRGEALRLLREAGAAIEAACTRR
ncbi:MAG: IclR family transcriptional regulator [Lentisphaeria bacterium]|nr:IclR family transcriptional regulator [Lentisphaeria bacterium]